MFRGDGKLHLSARDRRRWTRITGFEPVGINCVKDLAAYVQVCKAHYWGISKETRFIHWLIDEEFRRCVGGDGGGTCDAASNSKPEQVKRGSLVNGTRSLTLLDGGRAALERELLWLVALGNAGTPRAFELQRMLSARRLGSLRLVGQIGDATGGADDAKPSSDR
jgi:hypothetical protein